MTERTNLPCPFCGATNLLDGSWYLDDDGEHEALECADCFAGAPVKSWNRRPDPWRYPPEMPLAGTRILMTYRREDGTESMPICHTVCDPETVAVLPIARWMPIPRAR